MRRQMFRSRTVVKDSFTTLSGRLGRSEHTLLILILSFSVPLRPLLPPSLHLTPPTVIPTWVTLASPCCQVDGQSNAHTLTPRDHSSLVHCALFRGNPTKSIAIGRGSAEAVIATSHFNESTLIVKKLFTVNFHTPRKCLSSLFLLHTAFASNYSTLNKIHSISGSKRFGLGQIHFFQTFEGNRNKIDW